MAKRSRRHYDIGQQTPDQSAQGAVEEVAAAPASDSGDVSASEEYPADTPSTENGTSAAAAPAGSSAGKEVVVPLRSQKVESKSLVATPIIVVSYTKFNYAHLHMNHDAITLMNEMLGRYAPAHRPEEIEQVTIKGNAVIVKWKAGNEEVWPR